MVEREHADDRDETDRLVGTGSGDPNDDRAYLQHQPPAQVDQASPALTEDEDPVGHDVDDAERTGSTAGDD